MARKIKHSKPLPKINNIIVVSDTHCGCRLGLCPPKVRLDDGGFYHASALQQKTWAMWQDFWHKWVPEVTHGEPFTVVVNGDTTDGVHHGSVSQVSHNLTDQRRIAMEVFKPIVEMCEGRFYMIRGTEAHVGKSAQNEEDLAEALGAIADEEERRARYELWIRIGGKHLVHFMHHIGTTGRSHYETSAVMAELAESFTEAGRWERQAPTIIVRSHRHRHIEVKAPTKSGQGIAFVTPAWQLKTPFAYKIPGGRISVPQLGGSLIRMGEEVLYTRHKIYEIDRTPEVRI